MHAKTMISTPITCQYAEIPLIPDVMRTSKTFTSVARIMNPTKR